ncbi:MAG: hypothetical protein AAF389_05070 [Gemmatimonadota bacterium]
MADDVLVTEPVAPPVESEPVGGRGPEYEELHAAVHQPFRDALLAADDDLVEGFVQVIVDGLEKVREVSKEVGLDGAPSEAWVDRAQAALDLRRAVRSSLIAPLRTSYEAKGPWSVIHEAGLAALDEANRRAAALPESVESTWPKGALDPRPSDRRIRRIQKSLARGISGARKAGGSRKLPARALARQHLADVATPVADDVFKKLGRGWATWGSMIETSFTRWGEVALRALVLVERPDEEDVEERWAKAAEAFNGLIADLEHCLEEKPSLEPALARLRESRRHLEADADVAGSFVLSPTSKASKGLVRSARLSRALEEWDSGVAARLELFDGLLSLFVGLGGAQQRLASRLRDGVLSDIGALSDAAEAIGAVRPTDGAEISEQAHHQLAETVRATLEPALAALPEDRAVQKLLTTESNGTVDAVMAIVRQTPSDVRIHAPEARLSSGARPVETRTVAVQELTRQSFDALRVDRIRTSTLGLSAGVELARTNVAEFSNVFTFAHDAALKELEDGGEECEARATGLVREAIDSITEGLRAESRGLEKAYLVALGKLADEVGGGSVGLVDRLAAGGVAARLLRARSIFSEARAWVNERWGPPVDRAAQAISVRFRLLRRFLSRGVQVGGTIVGAQGGATASTRSVKELADTSALTDRLPLVYQRLFTFDPLSDSSLLRGRSAELAEGMSQWRQWEYEDGVPLVVTGRQGTGITSFLNALGTVVEEDGSSTLLSITLSERVSDEETLARFLSQELGVAACDTLDALAEEIFNSSGDIADAVAIDNLEHVYLRVAAGTDLVERLLTLMAETAGKIFWLGGVTTSAWQLIAIAEPTAVSQVNVLDLEPLNATQLREAVMTRHRRSGLAVRFEEPTTQVHRIRRWFSRIRDEEGFQEQLESRFFDALHRTSSGHLPLALYQWLSTVDFEAGEGVSVPQPSRPNFSVLDSLTLTQNFTLKAFLEHRTLTLAEHDEIFRLPRHESYQIFESLGNRHLIEVAPAVVAPPTEDGEERSEIAEELRYRLSPLLVGTVINHLRARNIVH